MTEDLKTGSEGLQYEILEEKPSEQSAFAKELTIKVAAEVLSSEVDKAIDEVVSKQDITLKGFSPGYNPPTSIIKVSIADKVKEQVIEDVVGRVCLDKCKVRGFLMDTNTRYKIQESKSDLLFVAYLHLLPNIALPDVLSFELTNYQCEIAETDITTEYERIKNEVKLPTQCEEDIIGGDKVTITTTASIGTKQVQPLCKDNVNIVAGATDQTLLDIPNKIIGLKVGEIQTFEVTIPQNYPAKSFRNKTAQVQVKIINVIREEIAKDDETFLKALGISTAEEIKPIIKQKLEAHSKKHVLSLQRQEAEDKLVQSSDFVVPKEELANHLQKYKKSLDSATTEEIARAEQDIKLVYLLSTYARHHRIELTVEDMQGALQSILTGDDKKDQPIIQFYRNNANALDRLKAGLQAEKIVQHIIHQSKKIDQAISYDDLIKKFELLNNKGAE